MTTRDKEPVPEISSSDAKQVEKPTKPGGIDAFRQWFKEQVVALNEDSMMSGKIQVPDHIIELPCGCTKSTDDGVVWTLMSEPSEQFAQWRTSQVICHSSCGKCIGEIPAPWVCI